MTGRFLLPALGPLFFLEFFGGFGSGNRLAHQKKFDNSPGYKPIHQHGKQCGPLKSSAGNLGLVKNRQERRSQHVCHTVNKTGKPGVRIGAQQFKQETEQQQKLNQAEQIPDHLYATV